MLTSVQTVKYGIGVKEVYLPVPIENQHKPAPVHTMLTINLHQSTQHESKTTWEMP